MIRRGLSVRQRLYIQGLARGLTKKQACLNAGYSETTARVPSLIETPTVREAFARLIRRYIPAHKIIERIAEGLDATETKFFQKDGIVTDQVTVVDWPTRLAYCKVAAEYGGYVDRRRKSPR